MTMIRDEFSKILSQKIENWLQTKEGQSYKWARFIRLTPDIFNLICRLSADKEISAAHKARLAPVLSYFISPFDIIPEEYWGAMGYVDDLALSAMVLQPLLAEIPTELIQKYWTTDEDLAGLLEAINFNAEEMVGKKYFSHLLNVIK